jgi:putative tricarboxylic transport membrane protein
MKFYEQVLNLVWILLAVGICFHALWLKLWVSPRPGSGLLPFIAGLIIGVVGVVRVVSGMVKRSEQEGAEKFWETSACRNRVLMILIGFIAMAYFLEKLGFLFTSILITSSLLYVIKPQNMIRTIGIAALSCGLIYVLFVIILHVNLPKSILGF